MLIDSDGDEIADDEDICPGFDDTIDVDADGVPDGCDSLIDSDADGVSDEEDLCAGFNDTMDQDADGVPDDCDQTPLPIEENATENASVDDGSESTAAQDSESSDSKMLYTAIIAATGLLIVFISAIALFMRSPKGDSEWDAMPQMADVIQGPPLPETGLPEGWTMEQWEYYGQQYLDDLSGHNNG